MFWQWRGATVFRKRVSKLDFSVFVRKPKGSENGICGTNHPIGFIKKACRDLWPKTGRRIRMIKFSCLKPLNLNSRFGQIAVLFFEKNRVAKL